MKEDGEVAYGHDNDPKAVTSLKNPVAVIQEEEQIKEVDQDGEASPTQISRCPAPEIDERLSRKDSKAGDEESDLEFYSIKVPMIDENSE